VIFPSISTDDCERRMTRPPTRKIGVPVLLPPAPSPRMLRPAGAEAVFARQHRPMPPTEPPRALSEELVAGPDGAFHVRSAQRQTLAEPTGTFNFVRVHGHTPHSRPILVSPKLAHAQLAAGRPVVYAGTARFERGEMAWWSNYSGTYQPIAAFRAQAGLPDAKFVPWQKLQMGGVAMQRGTFSERRTADAPLAAKPAGTRSGGPSGGRSSDRIEPGSSR
jgi:hypothetical protein